MIREQGILQEKVEQMERGEVVFSQDELDYMLRAATNMRDVACMYAVLRQKANPNRTFVGSANTALLLACGDGFLEGVRILLNAGAEPAVCIEAFSPPLYNALFKGHVEVVVEMMRAGADPERMPEWCKRESAEYWLKSPILTACIRKRNDTPAVDAEAIGDITLASLLEPDARTGLALGCNPVLWRYHAQEVFAALESRGEKLCWEDMQQQRACLGGDSLLDVMLGARAFLAALEHLEHTEEQLDAYDLLVENGKPTVVFNTIQETGQTHLFMHDKYWHGRHPAQLRKVCSFIPEMERENIPNLHMLTSTLRKEVGALSVAGGAL